MKTARIEKASQCGSIEPCIGDVMNAAQARG
jgi:hypothetical protein